MKTSTSGAAQHGAPAAPSPLLLAPTLLWNATKRVTGQ
jgi:hypothetical protein